MLLNFTAKKIAPFILVFPIALLLSASYLCADSGIIITCENTEPGTGKKYSFKFNRGKPSVVCSPRSILKVFLQNKKGVPLFITSISQSTKALNHRKTFKLTSPSNGVQFSTPAIPGDSEIVLNFISNGKEKEARILCLTPFHAEWNRQEPWLLEIEDFSLGIYPDSTQSRVKKIRLNPLRYTPPIYFAKITEKNIDSFITPNLRISDLVIPNDKTNIRHSPYFPVNYFFLEQFENLYALFQRKKLPVKNMKNLSAFRTPEYNGKIGSSRFSQHIYGNAFDFFFDRDNNGTMDDLNSDDKVDLTDARLVIDTIEEAQKKGALAVGGTGFYFFQKGGNSHRLTFHIDFRGYRAFWAYYHKRNGKVEEINFKSKYFKNK